MGRFVRPKIDLQIKYQRDTVESFILKKGRRFSYNLCENDSYKKESTYQI